MFNLLISWSRLRSRAIFDCYMKKLKLLISSCRGMIRCAATAVLLTVGMAAAAQTVSISPKTGNVISAVSYEDESHLDNFGGAWVHNQLPMTLISSDKSPITEVGLMKEHANNISVSNDGYLIFASGSKNTVHNHLSLSLPKGYRFTSYKIVMDYDDSESEAASTVKEMDGGFANTYVKVVVGENMKNVVLQRTSLNVSDMGNILYFLQDHGNNNRMGRVKVTSFVVTFECTDKFNESLHTDLKTFLEHPVSCLALPFNTHRTDLGKIEQQTNGTYTSYKYTYTNVKDLKADFLLYDESGVVSGTAVPGTVGDKSISSVHYNGQLTFVGLKNNTYWLETPTDAVTQNNTRIPVGYRIVGARVLYANNAEHVDFQRGDNIYITDGHGKYMNSSRKFTPTKVEWTYGEDGKVSTVSGNKKVYLQHKIKKNFWSDVTSVSLSTTTSVNQASVYNTKGLYLFYGSGANAYTISYDDHDNAVYDSDLQDNAVVVNANPRTTSTTGFTIKLFDKTGKTVHQQATVSADHPQGDLILAKINNDAIKLQIEGLEDGQEAFVCFLVQLEALNPYIDKMDITCTQLSGGQALKNQYLADDFTIGTDGKVDFGVPSNFDTTGLKFAFDGLHSKSADETYPGGQVGKYSRYHFVMSDYYEHIGENLQDHRSDAADYDYNKKIRVDVAGTKAFRCNNSDLFKAGTIGSGTFNYEEYRYSNAEYAKQGGKWNDITTTENAYRDFYMVVCDETRYNIAPTTTPRHAYYAYYSTSMKLERENYKPVVTYTRLYDNAMLEGGFDNNFYAGIKVTLKDNSGNVMPDGSGYVYAQQVIDMMNEAADGKPVDLRHVLYVDLSKVKAVITSENDATIGKLSDIKALLGNNALIYLPQGVTANLDNVATKSEAGDDFNAENDIVLTDKLPFYSLYDIRLNADNEVVYNRTVTKANNTCKWASVVMPFTMALDPETGVYRQSEDGAEFMFYTMNADNSFSSTGSRYSVNAHFSPCSGVSETEANKPYLVNIEKYVDSSAGDDVMFTLRQSGATIVKTPASLQGETAKGSVDGSEMSLVNRGTFSGEKMAKGRGVFYFNKDLFVSSLNLDERYPDVYILPFRTWYDRVGTSSNAIRSIRVSTEPNLATNISRAIADVADAGFNLSANAGVLTVKATKDVRVSVRAINGKTLGVASLRAGDSRSFSLPTGIYVVNGSKVVMR